MSWRRGKTVMPGPIGAGHWIVSETETRVIAEAGDPCRRLACPGCKNAVGGNPVRVVVVSTGVVCPADGAHLISASFLFHESCLPLTPHTVVAMADQLDQSLPDQIGH